MSRLPLMACPACGAEMTLDVVFGHLGTREAVIALAQLDPNARLIPAAVRYCALFAPAKQRLRHERMATLLAELRELIAPAKIERGGRTYAAPRDYWIAAMDDMTGPGREALKLPMTSHGYLKAIVAGYAEKAEASAERSKEARATGRTQVGGLPPPPPPPAQPAVPPPAPARPNPEVFARLRDALKPKEHQA